MAAIVGPSNCACSGFAANTSALLPSPPRMRSREDEETGVGSEELTKLVAVMVAANISYVRSDGDTDEQHCSGSGGGRREGGGTLMSAMQCLCVCAFAAGQRRASASRRESTLERPPLFFLLP